MPDSPFGTPPSVAAARNAERVAALQALADRDLAALVETFQALLDSSADQGALVAQLPQRCVELSPELDVEDVGDA